MTLSSLSFLGGPGAGRASAQNGACTRLVWPPRSAQESPLLRGKSAGPQLPLSNSAQCPHLLLEPLFSHCHHHHHHRQNHHHHPRKYDHHHHHHHGASAEANRPAPAPFREPGGCAGVLMGLFPSTCCGACQGSARGTPEATWCHCLLPMTSLGMEMWVPPLSKEADGARQGWLPPGSCRTQLVAGDRTWTGSAISTKTEAP